VRLPGRQVRPDGRAQTLGCALSALAAGTAPPTTCFLRSRGDRYGYVRSPRNGRV